MEYTNTGLVDYAKAQLGNPYWYGTYGQIGSAGVYASCKKMYPLQYPPKKWTEESFRIQYGKKVHDCSGLIKGYLMTPDADKNPYAPAVYNPKYDWSANTTIEKCTEQGTIGTMPEVQGLIVWKNNHVGVYIGNGEVIEAKGHAYGVVKTKLKETGWLRWGKHPAIKYISIPKPDPEPTPSQEFCNVQMPVLRKGDKKDEVTLLQVLLNALDIKGKNGEALEVDGSFGGNTDYAVQEFQRRNGLKVDGIVGEATWKALFKKRYKG